MLKGSREAILHKLQPVSIHGQLSYDLHYRFADEPDSQMRVARVGPEALASRTAGRGPRHARFPRRRGHGGQKTIVNRESCNGCRDFTIHDSRFPQTAAAALVTDRRLYRRAQVADARAEQTHRPPSRLGLVQQRHRPADDRRLRRGSGASRVAARDRGEVVVAHLDRHRPREQLASRSHSRGVSRPFPRCASRIVVEVHEIAARMCSRCPTISAVVCDSPADRRALRELLQPVGQRPDRFREHRRIRCAHVDQLARCRARAASRGHRPDAPQRIDRQPLQERARRARAR